ncbi:MAG: ATP-binding protein [Candidatus Omnitrophota bacterium]
MAYHVLLVDDDPYFRSELGELLDDFEIHEARSGEEALGLLKQPHSFDAIILDEMLPGAKGTEIIEDIQRLAPGLRIILLTGFSSKDLAIEALRAHPTDYIEKPLNPKKIERIREIVKSAPGGEHDAHFSGIDGKIERAKYYAQRNFDKKLTLNDVADEVCLSPKYLSRIFKEHVGMSFSEYKIGLRIEKAKELLATTGDNIEQISEKLGYQNPESFIKIFRESTGSTPRQYREADKKNHKKSAHSPGQSADRKNKIAHLIYYDAQEAIIQQDLEGRILMWNPAAEKLYGWRQEDVLDKYIDDVLWLSDQKDQFAQLVKELKRGKKASSFEIKKRAKNEDILDVWITLIPEFDSQRELCSFITIERDITQRTREKETLDRLAQKNSAALRSARSELEKKNRLTDLGRMSARIAHELRNPLAVIETALWNIRKKADSKKISRNLQSIEQMIRESDTIINNLLNYSRMNMPEYQEVAVTPFLQDALNTVKALFPRSKTRIKLDTSSLRREAFQTDPIQLKQILNNLLKNAVEATLEQKKKGEVSLTAKSTAKYMTFIVKDNGIGIAKKDLERIQEPFVSIKRKGTGLGLAICRELAHLHDGKLDMTSRPGRGTTVTLRLPVNPSQ